MAVVQQVSSNLTDCRFARYDAWAESSAAEGTAEVSRIVGRKLLFVDGLEDGDGFARIAAQHVAAAGAIVCKLGAVALVEPPFDLGDGCTVRLPCFASLGVCRRAALAFGER